MLQYYASAHVDPAADRRPARRWRRLRARWPRRSPSAAAARSRSAPAERGGKRRILELAERNARLALDQEKLETERRRQQRVEALDGLQEALGLDALPVRIECFDISNLGGTHTVASMVVFEGGAPKKSDYRRFTHPRRVEEGVPTTSRPMEEVLSRRLRASGSSRPSARRYDAERDASLRRAARTWS